MSTFTSNNIIPSDVPADQEPTARSHVEPASKSRNKPQSQRSNRDQQPAATADISTSAATTSTGLDEANPSTLTTNNNISSNAPVTATAAANTSHITPTNSSVPPPVVLNNRGGEARKRKIFNPDRVDLCCCGCNMNYDYSCMSHCKGEDCDRLINRTCVPSTWLCSNCTKMPRTDKQKS